MTQERFTSAVEQEGLERSMVEKCPCDCKSLPEFTEKDVKKVVNYFGLNTMPETEVRGYGWTSWRSAKEEKDPDVLYDYEKTIKNLLQEGMNEEREHCDITHGDAVLTAKIALAHLKEDPEYYAKLKKAGLHPSAASGT